ncbi:hypothetical protein [Pseudoalteromonas luteoviolacea]|uniref:Uncharacterized protein n=1 Tax=Pseudoalteromonas luteoviolacea NCIMB 1942 TaxID=1365253 RepID=A0A167AKF6_9GAMM|nr:hypothetical protein [Pseudoalteromonas luteoviolacea]KZN45499.1 hypothetical protein N482_14775 [Pseudoalteromonas luteoviolacea NCIMB 1942]
MSDLQVCIQLRLEPGCMGPQGKDHIETFCQKENTSPWQNHFAIVSVVPRYDKTLPEWEYRLKNKLLKAEQANRVVEMHNTSKADLEEEIETHIAHEIDRYMEGKL